MPYETLIAQRAEIDKQIAAVIAEERAAALVTARELVAKFKFTFAKFKFTFAELTRTTAAKSPRAGVKVVPKYRDNATGQTWSGRGVRPLWLQGKDLAAYLIA